MLKWLALGVVGYLGYRWYKGRNVAPAATSPSLTPHTVVGFTSLAAAENDQRPVGTATKPMEVAASGDSWVKMRDAAVASVDTRQAALTEPTSTMPGVKTTVVDGRTFYQTYSWGW